MQDLRASRQALLGPEVFGYDGPLNKNILNFVRDHGVEVTIPAGIKCWFITLKDGTRMHVYAETVGEANATCDQCRIMGWGVHPVSTTRYHVIVPAEVGPDSLEDPRSLPAVAEACYRDENLVNNYLSVGLSLNLPTDTVAAADRHLSPYNAPATVFDSARHRLHGVIHSNGFGHLLRVNGREGGSRSHSGADIVDLWDGMCQGLRARCISVEDVSSKSGMELRVLYTAAYGHTWYGKWGYVFGRGPYNTTEFQWNAAGHHVAAAALSLVLQDFEGLEPGVPAIIKRYRLPVGVAVRVKDLGALLFRLLYLQAKPEDALPFFDPQALAMATETFQAQSRAASAKRGRKRGLSSRVVSKSSDKKLLRPVMTTEPSDEGPKRALIGEQTLPKIKLRVPPSCRAPKTGTVPGRVTERSMAMPLTGKRDRADESLEMQPSSSKRARKCMTHVQRVPVPAGDDVLGQRVRWYCRDKRTWYQGTVMERVLTSGMYKVAFRNFTKELDLSDPDVMYVDDRANGITTAEQKTKSRLRRNQQAEGVPQLAAPPTVTAPVGPKLKKGELIATNSGHLKQRMGAHQQLNDVSTVKEEREEPALQPRPQHEPPAPVSIRRTSHRLVPGLNSEGKRDSVVLSSSGKSVKGAKNILPLSYKAELARGQDAVERARQLSRALKSLFPASKKVIGSAKSRSELDAAFKRLSGKSGPPITYKDTWWESLPRILQWGQAAIHGSRAAVGQQDVGCTVRCQGDCVEIDRQALHTLGLYPESWSVPFVPQDVQRANEKALNDANEVPPIDTTTEQLDGDLLMDVKTSGGKPSSQLPKLPHFAQISENVPSDTVPTALIIDLGCRKCRKPKVGCKNCRLRELERLRSAKADDIMALVGSEECCKRELGCPNCWLAVKDAVESHIGKGHRSMPELPKTGSEHTAHAISPSEVKLDPGSMAELQQAVSTTGGATSENVAALSSRPAKNAIQPVVGDHTTMAPRRVPLSSTDRHPLLHDTIQRLVMDPSGPDQIAVEVFPRPAGRELPALVLPDDPKPWERDTLFAATLAVLAIAAAHKDRWVAPKRLVTLAQQTSPKKLKQIALLEAALAYLGNTWHDGWAIHRLPHPQGGMLYLAEPIGTNDIVSVGPMLAMAPNQITAGAAKTAAAVAPHLSPVQVFQAPSSPVKQAAVISAQANSKAKEQPGKPSLQESARPQQSRTLRIDGRNKHATRDTIVGNASTDSPVAPKATSNKLRNLLNGAPVGDKTPPVRWSTRKIPDERPEAQQQAVDAAIAAALAPIAPMASPTPGASTPPVPPPRPWMALAPGADVPYPATLDFVRQQVTRDLHHLFSAVLRVYLPEVAKFAAENAAIEMGERAATRVLKLRQLPREVQVLRDTKHFVKTCTGETGEVPSSPQASNSMRVWCKLELPIALGTPPTTGTRSGRKIVPVDPPPELLVLSKGATVTDLLKAATEVYRVTYRMCANFTVTQVVAGLSSGVPISGSSTSVASLLALPQKSSSTTHAHKRDASPSIPTVIVGCVGLDTAAVWLHAGGPEDWIVSCCCGTRDDDGEAMVACDKCGVWWHTRCVGVSDDCPSWVCPPCSRLLDAMH